MSRRVLCGALVTAGAMLAVTGAALAARIEPSALPTYGSIPASQATPQPRQPQPLQLLPPARSATPNPTPPSTSFTASIDRSPLQLSAPSVSIDAELVPAGVTADGTLLLPEPRQAGWWIGGAQPGDPQGTVVIAGHVDASDGSPGALYPLTSIRRGATVQVTTAAGLVSYRVTAMRHFSKQQLPRELFTRTGAHRLVLITCGGNYTPGRGYSDNVVAYAEPLRKK